MKSSRIAVVGIACRYPDADSPDQLWENVLAGRRAFRRLPEERMSLADYYSPDPSAPDRFYTRTAAVIEGFEFDRVKHRVAGSTFRSTDMVHWLALDTAARALEDAGIGDAEMPRETTGVVIGNSLTGEFSRANLMRLRWPYVRRTVGAALREQGWDDAALAPFLEQLEARYKLPFPAVDEDTLAGGLANTIAGRVCNHFDFKGGGYTVDGACSSSLLSVATACNALTDGSLDLAVAGGVDLSIDPFEVIGFAKTGALATGEMRVYDSQSNGFWPGEGCGMLVLMRDEDAVARGLRRHAVIAGWGYSSDGKGGITRPEAGGHRLAMRRAYKSAGFGIGTVSYFEGHGTGTAVGDATELRAFSEERRAAAPDSPAAAISTVKGNFGHTKAAAGVAGLIKAILAVRHQIIPPATGHHEPHPELLGPEPALRVPPAAELWPAGAPIRAGVSSMGFGGINSHIVVEHADGARRVGLGTVTPRLVRSRQDAELLLLDSVGIADLRGRVAHLAAMCAKVSFAELGDLAATLRGALAGHPIRAAVVATSPQDAERKFEKLLRLLDGGARAVMEVPDGVFLGGTRGGSRPAPRIGFLFPGQGAGRRGDGGALRRRFAAVDDLYGRLGLPADGDLVATAVAQPRIAASSVAALRVLQELGIEAVGAVGHSLGELTALHWAGAVDEEALLRVVAARGQIMGAGSSGGTMAGIAADADAVRALLADDPVVIAGYNGPRQTVVSGPEAAVDRVCARAGRQGIPAGRIAVSHAFHSDAVAPAAASFGAVLDAERFSPVAGHVVSTVTARAVALDTDIRALLTRQILAPVRFAEALTELAGDLDLLVEVGPGRVLTGLAAGIVPAVPAVSTDADGPSLSGLLRTVAAAYALGAPVRTECLFEDRFTRPLPLDKEFRFFANPCEAAPAGDFAEIPFGMRIDVAAPSGGAAAQPGPQPAPGPREPGESSLEILLRLAAERAELPAEAVNPHSNPLDELHLSSITVGQIMNQAAAELGVSAPMTTSAFATSTLAELAALLDDLADPARADDGRGDRVHGVAPWVRAFAVDLVPAEPGPAGGGSYGDWQVFATPGHPLAGALGDALRHSKLDGGVLLCLPEDCDERHTALMLDAAHAALARPAPTRFVAVGDRRGAAGLAKSLHLEVPAVATTVVTLPLAGITGPAADRAVARIVRDVAATAGFSEVHYTADGVRRVPVLRPVTPKPAPDTAAAALGPEDVILVTGGGKGITAECALALARDTGAAVVLLGRSDPAADPELAGNLERVAAAGVKAVYVRADVTRGDEVAAAVEEARQALGRPLTAVLHGAGGNTPGALSALDDAAFRRTLGPKIDGLREVLRAVGPESLRMLITFGSIIGRAGLRGEADYATANDWLTDLTYRVQEEFPGCRCLALEWSVWSGAGMGERLGVLESLLRDGIDPIPLEEGVAVLSRLLADPSLPTSLVVMGRAAGLPTLRTPSRELPLLRFVDRVQVDFPGVELVVDADLTAEADLYLPDHLLDGDMLFPAVFGMEAMVQAGAALTGEAGTPVLEDVEFLRPIVVAPRGLTTIRVAVLAAEDGTVTAVVRSADTGFQADHFRARLRYRRDALGEGGPLPVDGGAAPPVPLDPARDLYGPVLFQGARFQRLLGYDMLAAKECVARLGNQSPAPWFAGFLPADLLLADPGVRDAAMHSIQCCVPDATLLPVAVGRLHLADPKTVKPERELTLHARERSRDGDTYVYDVDLRDSGGAVAERWEGLVLRAVRKQDGSGPWEPALVGPYLERRVETTLGSGIRCVVLPDPVAPAGVQERRERTAEAVGQAVGRAAAVRYRADGKPEVDGRHVGASHGAGVTFAVAGDRPLGCDVETVADRTPHEWSGLLGVDGFALARLLADERGEDFATAATRVWSAVECLRKTGRARVRLTADGDVDAGPVRDGWVVLRAGEDRVATFSTRLRGLAAPAVFAITTKEGD